MPELQVMVGETLANLPAMRLRSRGRKMNSWDIYGLGVVSGILIVLVAALLDTLRQPCE